MGRHARKRRRQHAVVPPPQDRVVRAGHPHVRLIGRPALENLLVRGRDVRVRAENRRDPPIQVARQ